MGFFGFFGCFFNANPATRRIWEEPSILNLQWHAPPPASSCRSEIKDFLSYRSKTAIYLSLGLHKVCPGHRRSLQLTKEAIQHFKTWFFFLNVIFALLDPDPYSNYGSGSNGPIEYGSNTDPDPGSGSTTLDLRPINPEGCTILYIVHMGDLSILIF